MTVTFRCKCGRWVRLDADAPARCPNCLRVVRSASWGALFWCVTATAGLLGVVMLAASVWPRTAPAQAQVEDTSPKPAAPTHHTPTVRTLPTTPTTPTTPASPPPEQKPTPPILTPAPPPVAPPPPAPVPAPPRGGKLMVEPAGKYKEGDTFVQTVTLTRSSAFGILGVVTKQAAEYTLNSKLEVTNVNADGSIAVTQTVQAAKLLDATADLKEPLADTLKKAIDTKFEMIVAPTGKVTSLKGLNDPLNVKLGRPAEQQTLRLWSVLDADAWKELAGQTFFQPDKPGLGQRWHRDFTHDWGPLGSWLGRTDFTAAKQPEKNNQHRIDYAHGISHRPAMAAAELPFTIRESSFPTVKASGTIRYDAATHRVTAAEELFYVRGTVRVAFGGTDAVVEVEEVQKFRLTASEVMPRELMARPPVK